MTNTTAKRQSGKTAMGLLVAAAMMIPADAFAQSDARWAPWLGCWAPLDLSGPAAATPLRVLCVAPLEAGVQVVTVADGGVIAIERIVVSDSALPAERQGCTGTERINWSADGRRLYRSADLACQGGVSQRMEEILAIVPGNQWIDVQGATIESRTGVRVLRYVHVPVPAGLPADVAASLGRDAELARRAAAAPLAVTDVAEASRQVAPMVVEAWLAETGQVFALDARRLEQLDRAGVAGSVIDVMVALAYPRAFSMVQASGQYDKVREPSLGQYGGVSSLSTPTTDAWYFDRMYNCRSYDQLHFLTGACHNALGFGSELGIYGYGRWYWGNQPVIIVTHNAGAGSSAGKHGRVVNGEGYHAGPSSTTSSVAARPRIETSTTRTAEGGVRASGGYSGSGAGASGGTSSGGGARTAKPRN